MEGFNKDEIELIIKEFVKNSYSFLNGKFSSNEVERKLSHLECVDPEFSNYKLIRKIKRQVENSFGDLIENELKKIEKEKKSIDEASIFISSSQRFKSIKMEYIEKVKICSKNLSSLFDDKFFPNNSQRVIFNDEVENETEDEVLEREYQCLSLNSSLDERMPSQSASMFLTNESFKEISINLSPSKPLHNQQKALKSFFMGTSLLELPHSSWPSIRNHLLFILSSLQSPLWTSALFIVHKGLQESCHSEMFSLLIQAIQSQFCPPTEDKPLSIDEISLSSDLNQLLQMFALLISYQKKIPFRHSEKLSREILDSFFNILSNKFSFHRNHLHLISPFLLLCLTDFKFDWLSRFMHYGNLRSSLYQKLRRDPYLLCKSIDFCLAFTDRKFTPKISLPKLNLTTDHVRTILFIGSVNIIKQIFFFTPFFTLPSLYTQSHSKVILSLINFYVSFSSTSSSYFTSCSSLLSPCLFKLVEATIFQCLLSLLSKLHLLDSSLLEWMINYSLENEDASDDKMVQLLSVVMKKEECWQIFNTSLLHTLAFKRSSFLSSLKFDCPLHLSQIHLSFNSLQMMTLFFLKSKKHSILYLLLPHLKKIVTLLSRVTNVTPTLSHDFNLAIQKNHHQLFENKLADLLIVISSCSSAIPLLSKENLIEFLLYVLVKKIQQNQWSSKEMICISSLGLHIWPLIPSLISKLKYQLDQIYSPSWPLPKEASQLFDVLSICLSCHKTVFVSLNPPHSVENSLKEFLKISLNEDEATSSLGLCSLQLLDQLLTSLDNMLLLQQEFNLTINFSHDSFIDFHSLLKKRILVRLRSLGGPHEKWLPTVDQLYKQVIKFDKTVEDWKYNKSQRKGFDPPNIFSKVIKSDKTEEENEKNRYWSTFELNVWACLEENKEKMREEEVLRLIGKALKMDDYEDSEETVIENIELSSLEKEGVKLTVEYGIILNLLKIEEKNKDQHNLSCLIYTVHSHLKKLSPLTNRFDWFVGIFFLLNKGKLSNSLKMLKSISTLTTSSFVWNFNRNLRAGLEDLNLEDRFETSLNIHLSQLLSQCSPLFSNACTFRGFDLVKMCQSWRDQLYLNYLDWPQILEFLVLFFCFGPEMIPLFEWVLLISLESMVREGLNGQGINRDNILSSFKLKNHLITLKNIHLKYKETIRSHLTRCCDER